MALTAFHGVNGSVRWRLTRVGLEVEGTGVERSRGAPRTVTRVWEAFAGPINSVAKSYRIPAALIVATICTESGGDPEAVRLEPGYVSDEATPKRVSVGLTQTLISTAREVMQMSLGRDWLRVPANAVEVGTRYVAQQARLTHLDPPLVAAAYNAGGLYEQPSAGNRWKLRQFPIGTSAHCDRFVQFFNDAVAVLADHATAPAVGLDQLLGQDDPAASCSRTGGRVESRAAIEITFGANARPEALTAFSRQVLTEILRSAGLRRATISSTSRTPADQARVMYENLEQYGVDAQMRLYARPGQRVIAVYVRSKNAGKTPAQIRQDMETEIREIGPTRVSRHTADPSILNVFDVGPSSISNHEGFIAAVRADARVTTFFQPPVDPGFHLEIPQPVAP